MKNAFIQLFTGIGLIALASSGAFARDVTSLTVADGTATVTFEAGTEGDSHVLYYAWSNDGVDKGADLFAWPNALRVDRVADDATSYEFSLPASAFLTGQYACRAFLATSAKSYDYLVEGVKSTKSANCFVSTGFKPVGGKTVVAIDFALTATTSQQYIFGVNTTYSLCAYVSDGGKWSFSSNNGYGSWKHTTLDVSTERTRITLDAAAVVDGQAASVYTVTTPSGSDTMISTETRTKTAGYALALFGRAKTATTIDKQTGATIYSCSITNDGACVRDYRPCVYGGVAGLFDAVNNTFNPSSGSTALTAVGARVVGGAEAGDEVAGASAFWSQAVPDYTTPLPFVEAASLTFANGGSKRGPAPLTLTGANNWGGTFTVYEGTLVADFGQGLASTDNLVLNGGAYCPLPGNTFTGTFGDPDGQLLVAAGAEAAGFSAYGHPLTVRLGDDPSKPLVASNEVYALKKLILNDAYATDTLTLENGIDSLWGPSNSLELAVCAGTAIVKGCISNDNAFIRRGDGTLVLAGTNSLRSCSIRGNGRTVVSNTLFTATGWITVTNSAQVVFSNAVVNLAGLTTHGGTDLRIVGGSVTSTGNFYPGNRITKVATAILDNTTMTLGNSLYVYPGYYSSGNNYGKADLVITNGANLTTGYFYGRHGDIRQYGGTVKVSNAGTGAFRIGCHGSGTCSYYLYGGTLEQTGKTSGRGFHIGINTGNGSPTGNLFIYGGEAIMRSNYGYLGRYCAGGHNDKTSGRDTGNLYVRGGTFKMPYNGGLLSVAHQGHGTFEVSDGGLAEVNGSVCVSPNNAVSTVRNGTALILTNGTLKARCLYSTCTNDASTLVLDGGTLVANTSAAEDFLYGFTAASVGVGGATLDTAGFNLKVSQDFAARDGQAWDVDGTAAALADAPAFTKTGAGTLTLHGTNTYLCATCVSNGTLAVTDAQSLPATTTLRVAANAAVDLSGKSHTVANLMGSGLVTNGTLTVTGTVWPGYPDAGTLTVAGATLAPAKLAYVLGEDGTCGKLAVNGPLDLTGVEIAVDNLANKGKGSLTLVTAGSITGTPTCSQQGVVLAVTGNSVRLGVLGTTVIIR